MNNLVKFSFFPIVEPSLIFLLDYEYSLWGLPEGSAERSKVKHEVHTRSARRLQELCFQNGGIYIKLGQHIGQLVCFRFAFSFIIILFTGYETLLKIYKITIHYERCILYYAQKKREEKEEEKKRKKKPISQQTSHPLFS